MSHALTPVSGPPVRAFLLTLSLALALSAGPAKATPVISAGNLPFSGISPGGVDMATGELILVMRPDLVVDGPFPLAFRRYYASMLQLEGFASGRLGPNWLGTYDWKLTVTPGNATLVTNRGEVIRFTMGPGGSWNLVSPTYAPFKLDQIGSAWRIRNPVDRHIYFFDGTTFLLNQILDERGNALTLTYAVGGGPLIQVSDGLGRALNFSYEPTTGMLSQVGDGTRNVNFGYTGGALSSFTDAAGKPWAITTQSGPIQELITGITEPLGNTPITHSYDPLGRVASQMDALSHTAFYAYDTPTGNTYTDPAGNPWTYQHDPKKLTSLKDPNGGSALYIYDTQGRIDTYKRPLGDPTSFTYDPASGYVASIHFVDGNSISFDYMPHIAGGAEIFDVRAVHYPDGTNANLDHDPQGNLINYQDQAGFPWMGTYNSRGQILTWTNPGNGSTGGGTTTLTYDPQGRPATVRDNAGNIASYIYDPLSRLTQVNWPGGAHRLYTYDNRDNVTLVQDEDGNPWNYAYDDDGRLMTATDPLTHATGFVYDPIDRIAQVVDPLGHATLYDYDLNGRLFHLTDRSSRTWTYGYDALNRLMSVADPAGAPVSFGYDGDSRMTSEQDALGHGSTYQYDLLDRLTQMKDPVNSEFNATYDAMGRLRTVTGPLGLSLGFGYDPRGFLTSVANGTSVYQYQYTPHRRLSMVTDPNGNPWPRSYDPQARLTSAADPLGRTTGYEYDERSRLMRINLPDLSQEQITYDGNSNVTGRSFTDGTTFTYGYDAANRMTSATPGVSFTYDNADRMTVSNGFSYTHDFAGRLLSETLSPGKTVSYSYDPRGLLSQVSDWAGGNTSFTFDSAHRLSGITRANGTSVAYQYDNADRMTSAVEKDSAPTQISSIQIARDALGRPASINRRQPLMPGATMPASSSYGYDVASQVNGVSHDALGRMTADDTRALGWTGASQLKSYTGSSGADSLDYTDDPFKNPKKIAPHFGQVIQLAWGFGRGYPTNDDLAVSLPSRFRLHVRAPSGLMLYGVDGSSGARSFYHYDEAGNTAYLTNDGGQVTTEYAYGPFGGVSALGQTMDNLFMFGAARGMMALTSNGVSTGLWQNGGGVYDDRTMRMVSGIATASGSVSLGASVGPGTHPGPTVTVNPSAGSWMELNPRPPGGGEVTLNPQPFPPTPGSSVALNPQPFPPAPGEWVALNPQPFPPSPYAPDAVALNPQPFPPGGTLMSYSRNGAGNYGGNYAGNYAGNYGGNYSGNFGGNYSGNSGLTHDVAGVFMHELGHTIGLNHGGRDSDGLSDTWENAGWVDTNCDGVPSGGGRDFGPKRGVFSHFGVYGHSNTSGPSHNSWESLAPPMKRPEAPHGTFPVAAPGIPPPDVWPWVPAFSESDPGPYGLVSDDTFTSSRPFRNPCSWCPR